MLGAVDDMHGDTDDIRHRRLFERYVVRDWIHQVAPCQAVFGIGAGIVIHRIPALSMAHVDCALAKILTAGTAEPALSASAESLRPDAFSNKVFVPRGVYRDDSSSVFVSENYIWRI